MSLRVNPFLKLGAELLFFYTKWARSALLLCHVLDPLHLLLPLLILNEFHPLFSLLGERLMVYFAPGFGRQDNCIEFHLIIVAMGSLDPVVG